LSETVGFPVDVELAMKKYILFTTLLLFVIVHASVVSEILKPFDENPANAGNNCAACTVIVGILESISEAQEIPIENLMKEVCSWLPVALREPCDALISKVIGL